MRFPLSSDVPASLLLLPYDRKASHCLELLEKQSTAPKFLMPFHLHFCGAAAMLCASQALSLTAVGFQNPLHPPKLCVLFFDLSIHPSGHRNRSFELSSFPMPALLTSAKGLAAFPGTERHCGEGMDLGGSRREQGHIPSVQFEAGKL